MLDGSGTPNTNLPLGASRRRSRRLFVGLAALATALALVAMGPANTASGDDTAKGRNALPEAETEAAAPAPYTPVTKTTFNNPKGSRAAAERINDELDRAIDATPAKATIRIAAYLFNVDSTADKLAAAHRRGVNVQLLIDDGVHSDELARVRRVLGTKRSARSFVTTCRAGCHTSSPSIMHAKFSIFSQVGGATHVSMLGSANPHGYNLYSSWNNSHTIVNNKTIYNALNSYINDMMRDTNRNAYHTAGSGVTSSTSSRRPRAAR
jgi:phosphatidylserine/phosphatidylglycerophosphate/cardiolipin synthase-like enzyme